MNSANWVRRARRFLNTDLERARGATSENDLRVAIMDTHAALESVFRGYLCTEHGEQEALDKNSTSFPNLVHLVRQHAPGLVDEEMAQELLRFNALRNAVVHEQQASTRDDVSRFAQCTALILKRLLSYHDEVSRRSREHGHRVAQSKRSTPAFLKQPGFVPIVTSRALFACSLLYCLLPDLLPLNPVDDIVIGCPLMVIAGILIVGALAQKARYRHNRDE
jgi:hypothetical protein